MTELLLLIKHNFMIKNYQKTIEHCLDYLKQKNDFSIMLNLSNCYMLLEQYNMAIPYLIKCLDYIFQRPQVIDKLLFCSYALGDNKGIHKYYKLLDNISESELNSFYTTVGVQNERKYVYKILYYLYPEIQSYTDEKTAMLSILKYRMDIQFNLNKLFKEQLTIKNPDSFIIPWGCVFGFELSYHGMNSKELFIIISKYIRTVCPELNYISTNCKRIIQDKKIKIGFISSNFKNHSVAKDRRGIIKLLDRTRFEVYTLFGNDINDDIAHDIWNSSIGIRLSTSIIESRNIIENLKLDILVYCDLGMDMFTYLLAHMRLASIQLTTWGHSVTSGINTIDYYISSKLFEMSDIYSQNYYSEKLLLTEDIGSYYYYPFKNMDNSKEIFDDLKSYKKENKHLYICLGTLIKIHPIMCTIFNNILTKDINAIIVLINNNDHLLTNLEKYMKPMLGNKIQNIVIIPYTNDIYFYQVIKSADVILDTYPFGGCNSSLYALAGNKPVVTLPSKFLNGRFTFGFYKKMNNQYLNTLIASNIEEYVNIAYKLTTDNTYYNLICSEIKNSKDILFENIQNVKEWDQLLYSLNKGN